jgi:hypothetical protein
MKKKKSISIDDVPTCEDHKAAGGVCTPNCTGCSNVKESIPRTVDEFPEYIKEFLPGFVEGMCKEAAIEAKNTVLNKAITWCHKERDKMAGVSTGAALAYQNAIGKLEELKNE